MTFNLKIVLDKTDLMTILSDSSARDFVSVRNIYVSFKHAKFISKHCGEVIVKSVSEFTKIIQVHLYSYPH